MEHPCSVSIDFGDDERCPGQLALVEGLGQRWPVIVCAALDLGELGKQVPVATVQPFADGCLLRLKAQTRGPLARCRDPVVSDEATFGHLSEFRLRSFVCIPTIR